MSISAETTARSVGVPLGDLADMLWVGDYPRHHAARHPDKPAIICGDEVTTYGQLAARSSRVAELLGDRGIRRNDRVAYLGRNSDLFFPVFFGCIQAGVVLVPINWRCTAPEIGYVLEDSGARLVLVDPDFLEVTRAATEGLQVKPIVMATESHDDQRDSLRALLAEVSSLNDLPPALVRPADAVCIQMYTSGTTGRPKGVLLTHRTWSVARAGELLLQDWKTFTGDDVILSPMPNFHVAGVSWMLIGLVRGCTCVLTADLLPENLLSLCERHAVSRTFIVPTVIRMLVDEVRRRGLHLPHLKGIYYGAAPIGESLLHDAIATFGCEFVQFYGMTEITGAATYLGPGEHDPARPERLGSVGTALAGTSIEIRDPSNRAIGPRQPGEIYINSQSVMTGYYGKPEATEAALADGWYRTGDGGYLDEQGFLYLTDRIKDMIVSGGENVYPAEVEEALRRHPAVYDAAVVGRKDEKWGERILGVIELRPGQTIEPDDLIAHARKWIAGYKIPREIVVVESLPRTASGKIQRAEVRSRYAGN
jgi:fatty-acyl-CoA synthase